RGGALGRPAARAAGLVAGEAGRRDQLFEFLGQRRLLARLDGRGEADVMQQAVVVVEPEQQRADHLPALIVAEAADHAVGAAVLLDLDHAGPLARAVRLLPRLCPYAAGPRP